LDQKEYIMNRGIIRQIDSGIWKAEVFINNECQTSIHSTHWGAQRKVNRELNKTPRPPEVIYPSMVQPRERLWLAAALFWAVSFVVWLWVGFVIGSGIFGFGMCVMSATWVVVNVWRFFSRTPV